MNMSNKNLALLPMMLSVAFDFQMPQDLLAMKDCENCFHMAIHQPGDPGYCDMFEESPTGDRCGQFQRDITAAGDRNDLKPFAGEL